MANEQKRALRFDDHYGLTDAEWAVAEILHEGCWCENERDDYEGCGPQSRGADAKRAVAAVTPIITAKALDQAKERLNDQADRVRAKLSDRQPRVAGRIAGIHEAAGMLRTEAAALRSTEKGTNQ